MNKTLDLPGSNEHWIKLKGNQGWKNSKDDTIWKKDKLQGEFIKTPLRIVCNSLIDFYGKQIWPYGPKHKNKKP